MQSCIICETTAFYIAMHFSCQGTLYNEVVIHNVIVGANMS